MGADQAGGDGLDGLADRLSLSRPAVVAVLGLTVLGLLARLLWLGARPMHFDEARVAFRVLESNITNSWQYEWAIHGPLLQHLDGWLFGVLGPTDAAARLPVALVGGLLPAAALLFRDHLRDAEVAVLAGILALNPLLLYYSRFMRSDLLVAAFALVTLGALLRLLATRRPAYLHAAALSFALAFASKENAFVYVLCWGGMVGLVAGLEVLQPRRVGSREELAELARERVEELRATARPTALRWGGHAVLAVLLFAAVTVFLYAPRLPPGEGVALGRSPLPAVVAATFDAIVEGFGTWIDGPFEKSCGRYTESEGDHLQILACNLGRELAVLSKAAPAVGAFAVVGLVAEFRREVPRVLVPAAFYWGAASVVGYAWGADILFPPWVALHAVVPLAIPAAAGLVAVVGFVRETADEGDGTTAAAVGAAAVLLVAASLGAAVHHSFLAPADRPEGNATTDPAVVQFAQPEGAFRGATDALRRAGGAGGGVDVVVHGSSSIVAEAGTAEPGEIKSCVARWEVLPLSWYLDSSPVELACTNSPEGLDDRLDQEPAVVVTRPAGAEAVRERAGDGYVSAEYTVYQGRNRVVVFFDPDRVEPPARATGG